MSVEEVLGGLNCLELGAESWIIFENFCQSDDLSIDELRRMTEDMPIDYLFSLEGRPFLNRVCMNKNVTLEIVEHLLNLPQAINTCIEYGNDALDDPLPNPLHLACLNEDCPKEVIQLLIRKGHQHLRKMCLMYFTNKWNNTDIDCDGPPGGLPIHYYLTRSSNVDLNIVKELVANPEMLQSHDGDTKCTPINIFMHNKKIGEMDDVLQYLAETNPSSLLIKNRWEETPLHIACRNEHISARTIQILLEACPEVARQLNHYEELPLHYLCRNKVMENEVAIDVLKLLLDAHPDSVLQVDSEELALPIHHAVNNKSPAFCKLLVDAYPESVKRQSDYGLPFHHACCNNGRLDTLEYLFELYPECMNIRGNGGRLPIHIACSYPKENATEIIKFLLLHDPECLSKPVVSTNPNGSRYNNGRLALHLVCSHWDTDESSVTELLFDLYPEAILIRNRRGQLPIDIVRDIASSNAHNRELQRRKQKLGAFLSVQMIYARKAQDETKMKTTDSNGSLPLHNAIRAKAPLGSIKLLVKGNPEAVNVPDGSGMCPLDIASQFSSLGVVKHLAELSPDRLNACDVKNNFPLHHACRGGNCEVISYLLERPLSSASVSERNTHDMFPIQLFCDFVNEHEGKEGTPEYTETIWRLLTAYPETVLNW